MVNTSSGNVLKNLSLKNYSIFDKMKKQFIHFIFLFCVHVCLAQDPIFLNSSQSLVYLNPSFSGSNGLIRNQFSYRNQWPNLSGTFVTYVNTFDAYIKPINGGVSFLAITDDQAHGTLKTTDFSAAYAQHIILSEKNLKITPSVQVGYCTKTLDKTKLNFGDMIDYRTREVWSNPSIVPKNSIEYLDISSGLLINYNNNLFAGISMLHINEPLVGLSKELKMPIRTNVHASYNLITFKGSVFNFGVLAINQQNFSYLKLQFQSLLFKHLILGAGYSNSSGINIIAGYRGKKFTVQGGYDVTISKLSGNTAGSFELHLSFNLRRKFERDSIVAFENW